MPAIHAISGEKLLRLIGTPGCPVLIDLRAEADALLPAAIRHGADDVASWAPGYAGRAVVVACGDGGGLSEGVAAWLRGTGATAETLTGGTAAWVAEGRPTIPASALPRHDTEGRTLWVTRARPKVDRIACPWLIRRFVDPAARILYVPAPEVIAVAARFGAAAFDVEGEGVRWTHVGDRCSFDAMIGGLGLSGFAALAKLAPIVRGADTARPDLAPEAAGLLAVSLGLSRTFADDLAQLDAGMLVYDALYRWCRDAADETHDWTSHTRAKGKRA